MKILITGGAGFIGRHLATRLLKEGQEVVILDNFYNSRIEDIKFLLENKKIMLIKGDIIDVSLLESALSGIDVVVHLAAIIDVQKSIEDPLTTNYVNVQGTLNLLEQSIRKDVKKFVFASSTAVYGDSNVLPLTEDLPLNPISPYAASKAASELYCKVYNKVYNLETVVLRYFNVYGFGKQASTYSGVINKFAENIKNNLPLTIYGDGEQTRDFIYIDDVVDATTRAIYSNGLGGEVMNVATGRPTRIKDLAKLMLRIAGKEDLCIFYEKPRKGDIKQNYGSTDKAKKLLGFEAKVKIEEGITIILKSYGLA
ncbi:MAG: SDR family NAD(P)-dependent oxidoreductase [Thermoproteota archaeon]|nr:SDR family NAD(P)-dependent oxidoreductase [Candidatus Brockarchaeota archaeon]MBO3768570.1 SDR family NAD(P)-dependent oxidoreductase [Candidatus Brockarchaeota archaeon]MBO3800743.1 SDR family NAD(P)-dependent oxidoreductase [Candidatus Brockarchaeota archaeon]